MGLRAICCLLLFLAAPASAQEVRFPAADGTQVFADVHRAASTPRLTLLLFHQGGGDARGEYAPIVPRLLSRSYDVITVDLRRGGDRFGHVNRTASSAQGEFAYCDVMPDLEAALAFAGREGRAAPIVIWGSSYSATLVIHLAARYPDDIAGVLAFSPAGGEPMQGCDPEPVVRDVRAPLLVVRPAREAALDHVHAQIEAFRAAGVDVRVVESGSHGSSTLVPERAGEHTEATWSVVLDFLARLRAR